MSGGSEAKLSSPLTHGALSKLEPKKNPDKGEFCERELCFEENEAVLCFDSERITEELTHTERPEIEVNERERLHLFFIL